MCTFRVAQFGAHFFRDRFLVVPSQETVFHEGNFGLALCLKIIQRFTD